MHLIFLIMFQTSRSRLQARRLNGLWNSSQLASQEARASMQYTGKQRKLKIRAYKAFGGWWVSWVIKMENNIVQMLIEIELWSILLRSGNEMLKTCEPGKEKIFSSPYSNTREPRRAGQIEPSRVRLSRCPLQLQRPRLRVLMQISQLRLGQAQAQWV